MIGKAQKPLRDIFEGAVHRKAEHIVSDNSHPHSESELLLSGHQFRAARTSWCIYNKSFIPCVVKALNTK